MAVGQVGNFTLPPSHGIPDANKTGDDPLEQTPS